MAAQNGGSARRAPTGVGFVRENRPQLFVTGDRTRKLGVAGVYQF